MLINIFFLLLLSFCALEANNEIVVDVTKLSPVQVYGVRKPKTVQEIQEIVRGTNKPIAIAGARYSQGGQIAYPDALVIDMTDLNQVVCFNPEERRITIQTGATWSQVQHCIDRYNLSVCVMQSYNDFTVGGALSVNVHARDLAYGSIVNTVESIKIVLADGSLVSADRINNRDLFESAIGGYGLIGVICQATFILTDNIPLRRYVRPMHINTYPQFFKKLSTDKNVIFHNVNLYPNEFKQALSVSWRKTNKPLTIKKRLQSNCKKKYVDKRAAEEAIRKKPAINKVRPLVDTVEGLLFDQVVLRNYEMSYNTKQLTVDINFPTTMTLQEYFIPVDKLQQGIDLIRTIINKYKVNVLNLSIRHVPQDTTTVLAYARQESFALVLYLNLLNTQEGKEYACNWTRELTEGILALDGTYYLPYLICATKEQFYAAYPRFNEFMEIKKQYDPTSKFKNMLWKTYVEA